jgi:CDP-glycerol glycerophosphotransferase (TagB/SpsB family)
MIDVWVHNLTNQVRYNVIISLHPSLHYDNYSHFDCPNLKVAKNDLLILLPVCSIFVACVSSTIQFAIALGKPVINYDVYRYSSEMEYLKFTEKRGVVTVLNRSDFKLEIEKITSDDAYYEQLATYQKEDAAKWGKIDKASVTRFINLLDSLN